MLIKRLLGSLVAVAMSLSGCSGASSKGPIGAASIEELVERYKQAHRDKDIEAMRSIHLLYSGEVWYFGCQMGSMGSGEEYMPMLFDFNLVDAELVKLPSETGSVWLTYLEKREPRRENGFSAVGQFEAIMSQPYKLMLIGRRPGEDNGRLMEVDACMGVCLREERFFVYPASPVLDDAAEWVKTGRQTRYFHPPGNGQSDLDPKATLSAIPQGWEPIVQPHQQE